jgi:hypothetical protein
LRTKRREAQKHQQQRDEYAGETRAGKCIHVVRLVRSKPLATIGASIS